MAVNKKRVYENAAKAAHQASAAKRARVRAEKAAARDAYKEGIGAARGLKRMVVSSKREALDELGDTGISGLAKQQLISSLKQGIDSAGNIVPVERATLKPEMKDALAAANDELFAISEAEASKTESLYDEMLTDKRKYAKNRMERVRTRRGRRKEAAKTAETKAAKIDKEVNAALSEIRDAVYSAAITDSKEGEAPDRKSSLQVEAALLAANPDRFKALVDHLAGGEGSRKAAKIAARKFVRRYHDPSILDQISPFN